MRAHTSQITYTYVGIGFTTEKKSSKKVNIGKEKEHDCLKK